RQHVAAIGAAEGPEVHEDDAAAQGAQRYGRAVDRPRLRRQLGRERALDRAHAVTTARGPRLQARALAERDQREREESRQRDQTWTHDRRTPADGARFRVKLRS